MLIDFIWYSSNSIDNECVDKKTHWKTIYTQNEIAYDKCLHCFNFQSNHTVESWYFHINLCSYYPTKRLVQRLCKIHKMFIERFHSYNVDQHWMLIHCCFMFLQFFCISCTMSNFSLSLEIIDCLHIFFLLTQMQLAMN